MDVHTHIKSRRRGVNTQVLIAAATGMLQKRDPTLLEASKS